MGVGFTGAPSRVPKSGALTRGRVGAFFLYTDRYADDVNDLDRSIIATLAYYSGFGWPLTLMELRERLLPASRLGGVVREHALSDILERVEVLTKIGTVAEQHGMYILTPTSPDFGFKRIEQEKVWAQKWRHMLRRGWWLQAVPYVRTLCASGSLALGNMVSSSDWDMFVIAQSGRLYTARVGLLLTAFCMGSLRTKHGAHAADKFCFNHFITTDGLSIRHRSIYVGHSLAMLVPLYDPNRYLERVWQANQWIGDYTQMPTETDYVRRSVKKSRILLGIKNTIEVILNTPLGWLLEYVLRVWQQRRIAREPLTHEKSGRILYTDRTLEFHPRSFEAVALGRYNAILDRHGMSQYRERDSGLTR